MKTASVRPVQKLTAGGRAGAAVLACACLAVLIVAAFLQPLSRGHGTHQQLGLPPCGWVIAFDRPCMTCGMTTAFAFAADADFPRSFAAQPFGTVLAVLAGAVFWLAGGAAVFGWRVGAMFGGIRLSRWLWALGAFAGAGWAYKWLTWQE